MSPDTSPQMFYISIVIERQSVRNHPWLKHRWRVVGVVVAEEKQSRQRVLIREDAENTWFMWQGFTLQLHRDQAPSYYHNLTSETPQLFVICHPSSDFPEPTPFLVTLSDDEACAYLEASSEVHNVDIPPSIYPWLEKYVVENYIPDAPKKRQREAWFKDAPPRES
ncbi:DUF3305 domain-containing protein [Thioflexithrix psekupsensis]|uniref:DUF3305 domain-containing protein n=1 Tax=Thioflexithrix psekupsensis TaxID=1570016 RepID=A0A251XC33_9GAMM|nr:DUF3305 domain-containing protein [Thioflexithrix psekupsensis]OUD16214.1 hypothetical protein TPSD3_00355 [Thioflexithrix psekupsensis]